MLKSVTYNKTFLNIAALLLAAMFFSCGNDIKEVQDFLADKNLPIAIAKNVNMIHTDSGIVKTRLISPLINDFSNRKKHPYREFPKGIQITTFENNDSTTLIADYARTFDKTFISEVKGNVVITNHTNGSKLYTEQLFWDQSTNYIYTEKNFTFYRELDTIKGRGFEAKEDLTKYNTKNTSGSIYVNENDQTP